ncbi:hypothetical protein FRC12_016478 [Ceratobasidium sp. 428]|nr:hypothetical protein FRC12_016478 [Ceratobasidium sp. 428]
MSNRFMVYATSEAVPRPHMQSSQVCPYSIAAPDLVLTPSITRQVHLPPISTLPPLRTHGSGPEIMSVAELAAKQTRYALPSSGAGISGDGMDYDTVGMALPPAKLVRKSVCDKLPPIPSMSPSPQTTFSDMQRVSVTRRSGSYAPIWVHRLRASLLPYHLALFWKNTEDEVLKVAITKYGKNHGEQSLNYLDI